MDKCEIIERLKNIAEHAIHTVGEEPFVMSLDDGIAVHEAIELLKKPETNCSVFPNNSDTISRQAAIDKITKRLFETAFNNVGIKQDIDETLVDVAENRLKNWFDELPSAQPEQRWIPCSERLPEKPYGCIVTVWDTDPITMDEFENILPYFVGWDGEQWNDGEGIQCPFEVIAWKPLPEPYQGGEQE